MAERVERKPEERVSPPPPTDWPVGIYSVVCVVSWFVAMITMMRLSDGDYNGRAGVMATAITILVMTRMLAAKRRGECSRRWIPYLVFMVVMPIAWTFVMDPFIDWVIGLHR